MLKNASVGLKNINIPDITIRDLPDDILTVRLEADACSFNFDTAFSDGITSSNHGKTVTFSGTTEFVNQFLDTMRLESTALAISGLVADENPVANVSISVTDGKSQNSNSFRIYSDNYKASSFSLGNGEQVYVNGISGASKYNFDKWSTTTGESIFDAEKQDHSGGTAFCAGPLSPPTCLPGRNGARGV